MTRFTEDTVLTIAITAAVAAAAWAAMSLSPVARTAPLVVAVPTLGLLVVELVRSRGRAATPTTPAVRAAEGAMVGWVGVLIGACLLFGMTWGLPLFVGGYLRFRARESWMTAAVTAWGLWLVLFGVLWAILHVRVYDGLLLPWMAN